MGPRELHPDFIVLHPRRGLLILEVKDWKLEHIHRASRASFTLLTPQGLREKANPLEQARQYAHAAVGLLRQEPALRVPAGSLHAGNLLFPYSHGVVLSDITRRQFEVTDLGEVLAPARVICKDEMLESVDAETFQERLWGMFTVHFAHPVLSQPQADLIRAVYFRRCVSRRGNPVFSANTPDIPHFGHDGLGIIAEH